MAPLRGPKRVRVAASCGDRISALPDEALHRVLSFLPTHEAVQTCVLASRWRSLWKSTRRLSITGFARSRTVKKSKKFMEWQDLRRRRRRVVRPSWRSSTVKSEELVEWLALGRRPRAVRPPWRYPPPPPPPLSIPGHGMSFIVGKLNKFVNHLLIHREPGPLDEFRFCFDDLWRVDGAEVDMWIRYALKNAWQLPVLLANFGTPVHVELSGQPLVSEHLTRLELSQARFKGRILDFSCCTALEDLKMHYCIVGVDKIFSQSLKCLIITRCNFNSGAQTQVSVPSLLSLELDYCFGQTPLLESMPLLESAFVRIGWFTEDYSDEGINGECCGLCASCSDNDNNNDDDNVSCSGDDNKSDNDNTFYDNVSCSGDDNKSDNDNTADFLDNNNDDTADSDNNTDNVNCSGNEKCVLLRCLSSAKYLKFTPSSQMFTFRRDVQWCPTFSKLRTLALYQWSFTTASFYALLRFLQHTPVIEKLTLQLSNERKFYGCSPNICRNLLKKQYYLPHLRTVEVNLPNSTKFDGGVCKLWSIMSIWACLEHFNIKSSTSWER